MSEWMDGYRHVDRWLMFAGKLEGLIDAHKYFKGDDGDEFDKTLWRLAAVLSQQVDTQ